MFIFIRLIGPRIFLLNSNSANQERVQGMTLFKKSFPGAPKLNMKMIDIFRVYEHIIYSHLPFQIVNFQIVLLKHEMWHEFYWNITESNTYTSFFSQDILFEQLNIKQFGHESDSVKNNEHKENELFIANCQSVNFQLFYTPNNQNQFLKEK